MMRVFALLRSMQLWQRLSANWEHGANMLCDTAFCAFERVGVHARAYVCVQPGVSGVIKSNLCLLLFVRCIFVWHIIASTQAPSHQTSQKNAHTKNGIKICTEAPASTCFP